MNQAPIPHYEFPDKLPLHPVEPGTNLLVLQRAVGSTHRPVMRLLDGDENEGLLFVTTAQTGRDTIDRFEECNTRYAKNRMAVIDCSEDARESAALNIRTVSSPGDLTGINVLYSSLYEQLYSSDILRVRTGFFTLLPLLMDVDDFRQIYRFIRTTTGRIESADGLGIFVLDPETVDEKTRHALGETFDGALDVRAVEGTDDEYELRVRGLTDQPEGWQSVSLPADD